MYVSKFKRQAISSIGFEREEHHVGLPGMALVLASKVHHQGTSQKAHDRPQANFILLQALS
jgi:hypothetical protein